MHLPSGHKNSFSYVFFTQLYYPDITTTAIIMNDLAEDLASYGHNVRVVCAQPTYLVKKQSPRTEVHKNVAIRRVRTFVFDKNKIPGRMLNSTSCFLSMFPMLFTLRRDELLIFNTNPALLPLLGFLAAKLKKQKYVVLIHDLWPELPAHTGMIKEGGVLYKGIDCLNKLAFKYASGIIVLSETMKKIILQKVPEQKDRIYVIHNWADRNRVYPVEKENNPLIREFGVQNKKVVMYSGNLGRYQPLEVMIRAADKLRNKENIVFIFTGDGGKKKKIMDMKEALNLKNVTFFPFQPVDRLAESLSVADVSLMGIFPENEGVIMPSKLYGLLAVGKPIVCVCDPTSEIADLVEETGAGISSSIDDPEDLARKILSILDNEGRARQMGQKGLQYFQKHFERKMVTNQWRKTLEKIQQF